MTDQTSIYPSLTVVRLHDEAAMVPERRRNVVINRVNESCLRLAVFEGEYPWHSHPDSDELFLVLEGRLEIELTDRPGVVLGPGDAFTVPAGVIHRTRARQRSVNLCFEHLTAETRFVDADSPISIT